METVGGHKVLNCFERVLLENVADYVKGSLKNHKTIYSPPHTCHTKIILQYFACFGKKLHHLCSCSFLKLAFLSQSMGFLLLCYYRFLLLRAKQFWVELVYFVTLSFLGYWVLKVLPVRTTDSFTPRNLDLFFASVSATTVSSMSTVEMEVFSNDQLIVMTIQMFIGGEVFTSMVGLHFKKFKLMMMSTKEKIASVNSSSSSSSARAIDENIELGLAIKPEFPKDQSDQIPAVNDQSLKLQNSIELLGYVVLAYLLVVHFLGVAMVLVYLAFTSSARNIVKNKGLNVHTFSFFTTVSTFSSCGFVPTNENMIVFSKNSGLLLILIPQVLLGNKLYPSCLRYTVWLLGKLFKKQTDSCNYLLKNTKEVGYLHLLPTPHSSLLVVTVFGFILVQLVPFAIMEWSSESLSGLNSFQKIIGSLFQTVNNSRHTGETIVDLSIISPAILVLFIVMMYLPPYTSFLPAKENDQYDLQPHDQRRKKRRGKLMENLIFSQLSYLTVFIILVCITERKRLKEDPLNFNVLNIVLEVISAYGNVGFTTGYSCKRQLNPNGDCQDKWYGFSGRWSDEGKILLIAVMFFGRLKKFNMDGGKG
uniref:LOW QUALITY PROTEIN: sodium transporter HKT1-like n=1 Tax=Fragaria vesca subsp. vesca TaxID=101020 RepID=UPI0005C7F577|nr:PREDICTED: LOW QUALITY PROTEIN: sodium transporter HKT1-like [Fragaria vesca subsp. vesca]